MNIGTFLYIYFLFVIFSPDLLFSIPFKNKVIKTIIHGFLFSIMWLVTHKHIYYLWQNISNPITTEGAMFNDTTTTNYKEPEISNNYKRPLITKCFFNDHCVGTKKRQGSNIVDYFCFGGGQDRGCLWGSGDCRGKGDSYCNKYNMNSKVYTDNASKYNCSNGSLKGLGGWQEWTCDNLPQ